MVLDFATLTGHCVVALGPHTAVIANDEPTPTASLEAARDPVEHARSVPAWLSDQLRSEITDIPAPGSNDSALTRGSSSSNSPQQDALQVHIDIAAPATTDKEWGGFGKGATGFAVASIVQYLRHVAGGGSASAAPAV